uniref:Uncharacterized protein n=1 Tax=Plectus sambesii TaxID=2011161 RepID=A0A914UK07_9BILA
MIFFLLSRDLSGYISRARVQRCGPREQQQHREQHNVSRSAKRAIVEGVKVTRATATADLDAIHRRRRPPTPLVVQFDSDEAAAQDATGAASAVGALDISHGILAPDRRSKTPLSPGLTAKNKRPSTRNDRAWSCGASSPTARAARQTDTTAARQQTRTWPTCRQNGPAEPIGQRMGANLLKGAARWGHLRALTTKRAAADATTV